MVEKEKILLLVVVHNVELNIFNEIKEKKISEYKIIHNNEYEYEDYVNYNKPFYAVCKIHGKFLTNDAKHINKKDKCPSCNPKPITVVDPNFYILNGQNYYNCNIHGQVLCGKKRKNDLGCPLCAIKNGKIGNNLSQKNRLFKKFGDSYDISINENDVLFICKKHGINILLKLDGEFKRKTNKNIFAVYVLKNLH